MKKLMLFWPLLAGLLAGGALALIAWRLWVLDISRPPLPTPARNDYNVVAIAGCEYVEPRYGSRYFLIHKANCTNSIHGHDKL